MTLGGSMHLVDQSASAPASAMARCYGTDPGSAKDTPRPGERGVSVDLGSV